MSWWRRILHGAPAGRRDRKRISGDSLWMPQAAFRHHRRADSPDQPHAYSARGLPRWSACSDALRDSRRGNGYSLARLWLKTGRTHQIRVHMSYLGYPLAGDTWYGGDTKMIGRQALHCFRCHFLHPISGERIELSAPLYESFKRQWKMHI